jgi:hypothetical protein
MGQRQSVQSAQITDVLSDNIQWGRLSPNLDKSKVDNFLLGLRAELVVKQKRLYEAAQHTEAAPIRNDRYESFEPESLNIHSNDLSFIGIPRWEYLKLGPNIIQEIRTQRPITATKNGASYTINAGTSGQITFSCADNQCDSASASLYIAPIGMGSVISQGGRRKTRRSSHKKRATRRRR